MIYLDLPNINTGGTVEEQLSEIRSYIYKNNEQMNATLANLTTEKFWENTASAISSAENKSETPQLLSQYAKVRDLIIKTATEVSKTDEHYNMLLSGGYLAKSQFGEYLLNTSVEVDGKSTGFTEVYHYGAQINSLGNSFSEYRLDESMYIKRGLLDDSGGDPIYGIELGILNKKVVVDGETHQFDTAYRTRITPDKWSFIYNGLAGENKEVAYIQADKIYFPNADITGGSVNINDKFIVNSLGEMTATSGTFSGTLAAASLTSAFNSWSNQKIQLGSQSIVFKSNGENDFVIKPGGIEFYKRDTVDRKMGEIKRASTGSGWHWGLDVKLYNSIASFFSLEDDNGCMLAYIPAGVGQRSTGNLFSTAGLHINTTTDFHGHNVDNVVINSMNINGVLKADGATGVTGRTIVKVAVKNSDGTYTESYSDLYIHNGIITGITPLTPI